MVTPRLELTGISKRFPGVLANDDVSLAILPGEIHALLGENGAGKSTLVKIIYGVQRADAGAIKWDGRPVSIASPAQARRLGIGMVFQHFSLFDAMTVEENIAIGISRELARGDLAVRIRQVSETYGLPIDPSRYVHTLSVGERQRIEVVRCLLQNPKLLIMDEPTSVLTPQEVESLFETLRRLAAEGVAILYISHKLQEIKDLCHKATIMRQGRVVAECDPAEQTARTMAELMMGSSLKTPSRNGRDEAGAPRLIVSDLSVVSRHQQGTDLKNIDFQVRAGEIFGIAGIAGNGQRELMEALSGEVVVPDANAIRIGDKALGGAGPNERRLAGLGFVPEERLGHSSVPDMTLWENAFLSGESRKNLARAGFIRVDQSAEYAGEIVDAFAVKAAGIGHTAASLSGGNLQKFVIGREILQSPGVIVVLQPTWGVDAGSAAAIRQAFFDLAAKGTAVLVISQDLEELFETCDRIAVIAGGKLSQAYDAKKIGADQIGLLMAGAPGVAGHWEGQYVG